MKAMTIHDFGDATTFVLTELPKPVPTSNQVLIKVKASSVNPIDIKIRSGVVPAVAPPFPAVLNVDVAGVVEELGSDVRGYSVGDRVVAMGGGVKGHDGALAEFMRIDEAFIAKIPDNVSFEMAASVPVVGLTAWESLVTRGQIKTGQKVLIHGGTGGVGHIAVQLAVSQGAEVTATVSNEEKAQSAQALGAHHIVLYNDQTVKDYVAEFTNGKGYDIVLDTVGGQNLAKSFEAAAINGCIITTNARSTNDLSSMHAKGLTLHVVFLLVPLLYGINKPLVGQHLEILMKMMGEKSLNPLLHPHVFKFTEIGKAHSLLESGGHVGKICLVNDLSQ